LPIKIIQKICIAPSHPFSSIQVKRHHTPPANCNHLQVMCNRHAYQLCQKRKTYYLMRSSRPQHHHFKISTIPQERQDKDTRQEAGSEIHFGENVLKTDTPPSYILSSDHNNRHAAQ